MFLSALRRGPFKGMIIGARQGPNEGMRDKAMYPVAGAVFLYALCTVYQAKTAGQAHDSYINKMK